MHIYILDIFGTFFWVDTGIALLCVCAAMRMVVMQKIARTAVS